MADPQNFYRFAWCLEIVGPATIRRATTDLPEDAAKVTLGDFYMKGLKTVDSRIIEGLPNLFYGVRHRTGMNVVLSNADGDMDTTAEWRGAPFTLWHYDRELDVKRADLVGIITAAEFANGLATMQLGTVDDTLLKNPLPAATIDPKTSSPFERSGSPGVPLPVVFGSGVLVKPPNIHSQHASDLAPALDGLTSAYDYALGFGSNLLLTAAFGDWDTGRTGLERYGTFAPAPGSPTYLSTEADALKRATRFAVTGPQIARYASGMPIRFKTTTSGSAFFYSVVKSYDSTLYGGAPYGTNPENNPPIYRVEIYDALIDSGLNTVEIGGDYAVIRDTYTAVTDGILPVPAVEQAFTAIRLFGAEDTTLLALVENPAYPSGSGGTLPSTIIGDIIGNPVWGMSTHVQQLVDAGTFGAAAIALALAGLGGTIQGALAYDGKQVPAEQVLDWLCMIARGGRLGMNDRNQWTLAVDTLTSSVASFVFGPGAESGIRIKKVISYGRASMDQAVRNLVLHWSPLGRVRGASNKLTPQEYSRFSTKAVSGLGQDRHLYNPFIRDEVVAGKVLQYMAAMLEGADEQLVFVAGQEARDRTAGEVITAISTVDGFSGDWKIAEVSRSLADVQLSCIRHNPAAYDPPSGITTSSAPVDSTDIRTSPGPGPNLLPNPEPAPPLHQWVHNLEFSDVTGGPIIGAYAATPVQVPYAWTLSNNYSASGVLAEFSVDKSQAIRTRTVSGHYLRMVWTSVLADAPIAPHPGDPFFSGDGIFSDDFAVRAGTDHLISFYGDAEDGWYVLIQEDVPITFDWTLLPLVRDDTDTDGNGWTRFYGRWRPKNATKRAILGICVSKPGTYQLAGIQVEAVTGSARKPTDWRRHTTIPPTLTRSHEITLDGSSSYTAALIKAGDYVIGATARVTGTITFGTATQFSLGTTADLDVWARNISDPVALTTSNNYKPGTVATFFAEDQNVILSFFQATAGTPPTSPPGTAVSAKVMIVLEYTRSAPTPGP